MSSLKRNSLLFAIGGFTYGIIEVLWRNHTHWSMVLTGGACFLSLYKFFTKYPKLSTVEKCVIGSVVITLIEFFVGCVVNIWMKLGVWDYSSIPFNLFGQVCALYSTLWGFLCIPINGMCNKINSGKTKISRFIGITEKAA